MTPWRITSRSLKGTETGVPLMKHLPERPPDARIMTIADPRGVPESAEFAFTPVFACRSLALCGLSVSMKAVRTASIGRVNRRRSLNLLLDEIFELLNLSLATLILDAGYFLRIQVDARFLSDRVWVTELCRLQREAGGELTLQMSVKGSELDPFDRRVSSNVALLRSANIGVVARSSRITSPLDVEALARAGVIEIAASVETLCALAVGVSGAKALTTLQRRPALLTMCAQNLASTLELDVARALRCAFASGPFFGHCLNAMEAKQLVSRCVARHPPTAR